MLREEVIVFLHSYEAGEYDEKEHVRFLNWLNTAPLEEIEECIESYKTVAGNRLPGGGIKSDIILQIEVALDRADSRLAQRPTRGAFARMGRWFVAAALVGGLSLAGYRLFFHQETGPAATPAVTALSDVAAPKSTKATLTLGDGSIVELEDRGSGLLTRQNGVEITRKGKDGLVYSKTAAVSADAPVSYNVLQNPRGSRVVSLTLADGTRVWLNAASSLRYPVDFREERKVEITGEAYFEVASDPQRRFVVDAGAVRTVVLGTHFNVNAYEDEGRTTVTLLEGRVQVEMDNLAPLLLQPEEQALVTNDIRLLKNIDTRAVVAWKEGMFVMHQADIGTIMRQIGRWYNVAVAYEAEVPKGTISGTVPRQLNLSEILKVMEYSGIHVKIEDGKAIVKP